MKKPEKGSKEYKEYFKDGAPDWNEREEEFNEGMQAEDDKDKKESDTPINKEFSSGINLGTGNFTRDNLNTDEKRKTNVSDPTKESIGATDYKINTMDRSENPED